MQGMQTETMESELFKGRGQESELFNDFCIEGPLSDAVIIFKNILAIQRWY